VRVESQTVSPGPELSLDARLLEMERHGIRWVPGSWIVRPRPAQSGLKVTGSRRDSRWVWVAGRLAVVNLSFLPLILRRL